MNRRGFLRRTGISAAGVVVVPTVVAKDMCSPVPVNVVAPNVVDISQLTNELLKFWGDKNLSEFLMATG